MTISTKRCTLRFGELEISVSAPTSNYNFLSNELGALISNAASLNPLAEISYDKEDFDLSESPTFRMPLNLIAPKLNGVLICSSKQGEPNLKVSIFESSWPLSPSDYPIWQRPRKYLGALKRQFSNTRFLSDQEKFQVSLVIHCVESLVCLLGVEKNVGLLHSSAFSLDGDCQLFAGTGGVGKSTAILQLINRHPELRFVTDDWAIIHPNGNVCHYPRKINVYAYNTVGFPQIEDVIFSSRTWLDKFHWNQTRKKHGVNGTARRVSANDLYGSSTPALNSQVSNIFFLNRGGCDRFDVRPMSSTDFARRMSLILLSERSMLFGALCRWHATTHNLPLLDYQDLLTKTERLYRDFASNAKVHLVSIPQSTSPSELANYIEKIALK